MNFTLLEDDAPVWVYCPTCKVDRETSSLIEEEICPHCECSVNPPPPPVEIPAGPSAQ